MKRDTIAAAMLVMLAAGSSFAGGGMNMDQFAAKLIALNTTVLKANETKNADSMLLNDILARTRAANARQTAAFEKVRTRSDWEQFRDERLAAMRNTFGARDSSRLVMPPSPPPVTTTATLPCDGFQVENLVIAGRQGLPITANLYVPARPATNMPGILLAPSHHNPKWQGELQDMGMTWARSGCLVLVPDLPGHGEARQQIYGGREDYRWRYYMGMQLYAAGESLMAWMVADLRRGLDVLAARPGVDPKRLIVIGSVAGGGDLAAVLAATDNRVTCAIPYNYGSPVFHAPEAPDGTAWVDHAGGGDFDTVRCLRNNARDGFNPWLIVAACAPRYTVFAKEFDWQPDGDEGFARIAGVFDLYGARDRLNSTHGHGNGSQPLNVASHCNNVGPSHRASLYPLLARWLKMPVPVEFKSRLTPEQLTCLTPAARLQWQVRPVYELLAEMAASQLHTAAKSSRDELRRAWAGALGEVTPAALPELKRREIVEGDGFGAERLLLSVEPGILVPVVLLKPAAAPGAAPARPPVVIAVAQAGKDAFLCKRAAEIAGLLSRGVAVCLVDVRGVGETAPSGDRAWYSSTVELTSMDLMLGQTVLGARVRDLRSVLRHLQSRPDLDGRRAAVWGESFAPVNSPDFVDPPMKDGVSAALAEPMGATAALLLALFEDDVRAVVARGGLTGYAALLDGPACHVVMDVVVPRAIALGDLAAVAAAIAPRPLKLEMLVDGRNRLAAQDRIERDFASARAAYGEHAGVLTLSPAFQPDAAEWLAKELKQKPEAGSQ